MAERFLVLNIETAEVQPFFESREQAEEFIKRTGIPELTQADLDEDTFEVVNTNRLLIMPYYENKTKEYDEVKLYTNAGNSDFGYVAEFYEDTLITDFISTQNTPIRLSFRKRTLTKQELLFFLQDLDDDAELHVVDTEQDYCYEIEEVRTTDGDNTYADIVISLAK